MLRRRKPKIKPKNRKPRLNEIKRRERNTRPSMYHVMANRVRIVVARRRGPPGRAALEAVGVVHEPNFGSENKGYKSIRIW